MTSPAQDGSAVVLTLLVSIQSSKKEAKLDPSFYGSENNLGFNQEASVVTYGVF